MTAHLSVTGLHPLDGRQREPRGLCKAALVEAQEGTGSSELGSCEHVRYIGCDAWSVRIATFALSGQGLHFRGDWRVGNRYADVKGKPLSWVLVGAGNETTGVGWNWDMSPDITIYHLASIRMFEHNNARDRP
jgi:hypothetical protein